MSRETDGWRAAVARAREEGRAEGYSAGVEDGYRQAIAEVVAHVDQRCESAGDDIAAVQSLTERGEGWNAQYAHVLGVWLTWVEIQTDLGWTVGVRYGKATPDPGEAPTSPAGTPDVRRRVGCSQRLQSPGKGRGWGVTDRAFWHGVLVFGTFLVTLIAVRAAQALGYWP